MLSKRYKELFEATSVLHDDTWEAFWECDCAKSYVQPKEVNLSTCPVCNGRSDECADANTAYLLGCTVGLGASNDQRYILLGMTPYQPKEDCFYAIVRPIPASPMTDDDVHAFVITTNQITGFYTTSKTNILAMLKHKENEDATK